MAIALDWHVLTSYSSSDHWPIEIQIHKKSDTFESAPKWNLNKPNWKLFSELIDHDLNTNPIKIGTNVNQEHVDSIVLTFTNIILNSANIAIGTKFKPKKNQTHPTQDRKSVV